MELVIFGFIIGVFGLILTAVITSYEGEVGAIASLLFAFITVICILYINRDSIHRYNVKQGYATFSVDKRGKVTYIEFPVIYKDGLAILNTNVTQSVER